MPEARLILDRAKPPQPISKRVAEGSDRVFTSIFYVWEKKTRNSLFIGNSGCYVWENRPQKSISPVTTNFMYGKIGPENDLSLEGYLETA